MTFGIAGNVRKGDVPIVAQRVIERFISEGVDFVVEKTLASVVRKKLRLKSVGRTVSEKDLPARCDMLVSWPVRWRRRGLLFSVSISGS